MKVLLFITTLVFAASTVSLLLEFHKKFGFMRDFIRGSKRQLITYNFPGAKKAGFPVGMRNVMFRSNDTFEVLVGFRLEVPFIGYSGYDYYGFVASTFDKETNGQAAVIATYLGDQPVHFQFLLTVPAEGVAFSVEDDAQDQIPHEVYPPHFYQKWGFYA